MMDIFTAKPAISIGNVLSGRQIELNPFNVAKKINFKKPKIQFG